MNVQTVLCLLHTIFTCSAEFCVNPVHGTTKTVQIPDYYWKDFVGIIPEDAIEGGTDENGGPTYIGQAYIKNVELLPVIIYPGCKNAVTTAYGVEVRTNDNIKILCAKNKEKFEWISTKTEDSHLLTNRHLVVGGTEAGETLHIGRVRHAERLITGKVFSRSFSLYRGLWIPYHGVQQNYLSYEILTYNYNKQSISLSLSNRISDVVDEPQVAITINMWNDDCTDDTHNLV